MPILTPRHSCILHVIPVLASDLNMFDQYEAKYSD